MGGFISLSMCVRGVIWVLFMLTIRRNENTVIILSIDKRINAFCYVIWEF